MYNRQLYTLIQVADSGSFAKAADAMYISSVSIMKQMNSLEEHLGLQLLERTSQGVFLTPTGQFIYDQAKEMIKNSEEVIRQAREIAGIEQYTIRIGTSHLRPCRPLINLWNSADGDAEPFRLEIIPFEDDPASMAEMLESLGKDIDCFVSPCDSKTWMKKYNIQLLGTYDCQLAVSKKHRLARKKKLNWNDLDGESIMLIKRGESVVLNRLREDILENHPKIKIIDFPTFYDTRIFNECERNNSFMESLEIWSEMHPSIVTIPVEWDYKMPFGIVYSRHPSKGFDKFMQRLTKVL